MLDRFRVLAGGLDHPEGVAWDPVRERVYAGGESGQIYAIELDGTVRQVAATGGFILGLAIDGDGLVYACDVAKGEVIKVDPAAGRSWTYASGDGTDRMRAPNWLAFDRQGVLYVTDSGDWKAGDGRLWRVEPGGAATVWTTDARDLPNGCCLSQSGDALLVVETNRPGVVRVPILPDGSAGDPEEVVRLDGTVPDGIALATDGSLVIACYRPDALLAVRRDGSVVTLVEDREAQILGAPANLAFVGGDLRQVVTSNLARWHVAIGDIGLAGVPLERPRLAAPPDPPDRHDEPRGEA